MKRLALLVLVFSSGMFGLCSVRICPAAIVTADVAVSFPAGQYAPLEVGEYVNAIVTRYWWHEIPSFAENDNFLFWQVQLTSDPSSDDGITTFEVLTDGPVLMAVTTRWGGGGNSSGDWIPELTTRAELEFDGWAEFATGLSDDRDGYPPPTHEYIVFRRDSVAGEVFTYRTEKYRPPLIIRSEATVAPVPEPSTFATWSLLALCGVGYGWRRKRSRCLSE